jgi:hypothetical protein
LGFCFIRKTLRQRSSQLYDIYKSIHIVPLTDQLLENGDKTKEVIQPLLFGGDQLTEERITNAQRGFFDGKNDYEML